tara:strand:- start:25053 stop:25274 length:222 start_codon:yes stop_codon:yes gene_type:complete
MSELYMVIGGRLPVLADYDYDDNEKTVVINAVYIDDTDVKDILTGNLIETIEQNVFDSFDKELQEPDYEYIEG